MLPEVDDTVVTVFIISVKDTMLPNTLRLAKHVILPLPCGCMKNRRTKALISLNVKLGGALSGCCLEVCQDVLLELSTDLANHTFI